MNIICKIIDSPQKTLESDYQKSEIIYSESDDDYDIRLNGIVILNDKSYTIVNGDIKDKKKIEKELKKDIKKYKHLKLKMDAIPGGNQQSNLARILPKKLWNIIRENTKIECNNKCSICNSSSHRLLCHEVWEYDDTKHIQKLKKCTMLCSLCHFATHPGVALYASKNSEININIIKKHFQQINECEETIYDTYKKHTDTLTLYRSLKDWKIDYGNYNYLINTSKILQGSEHVKRKRV